jgi:hypothetical protein
MRNLRRNPHCTLGWNDPVATLCHDLHYPFGAIEELCAPMSMAGVQKSIGIVGSDGNNGARGSIQHVDRNVSHGMSYQKVAETQTWLARMLKLPAIE